MNDECAALMRASILQAEVAHEEGEDVSESVFRLGRPLLKRVPMGYAASTTAYAEELSKVRTSIDNIELRMTHSPLLTPSS